MFIAKAYAAVAEMAGDAVIEEPSLMSGFIANMSMVLILVVLFYFLLILPQQKRFKEHSSMLADLQKGDKIVTGGGLIGTIDKLVNDEEVLVDFGNGVKVTALRSSIQGRGDAILKKKPPANDQKTQDKSKG